MSSERRRHTPGCCEGDRRPSDRGDLDHGHAVGSCEGHGLHQYGGMYLEGRKGYVLTMVANACDVAVPRSLVASSKTELAVVIIGSKEFG